MTLPATTPGSCLCTGRSSPPAAGQSRGKRFEWGPGQRLAACTVLTVDGKSRSEPLNSDSDSCDCDSEYASKQGTEFHRKQDAGFYVTYLGALPMY